MIEPQKVETNKRGITYRYWDWNRLYDGKPRELHLEEALRVTNWTRGKDDNALNDVFLPGQAVPSLKEPARDITLAGPNAIGLESQVFSVSRFVGTGTLAMPPMNRLCALTMIDGELLLQDSKNSVRARRGETVLIGASASNIQLELHAADAILSAVH
ncbi:MAG: hypothetical protein R3A47_12345 [Polyangiales bacterium]